MINLLGMAFSPIKIRRMCLGWNASFRRLSVNLFDTNTINSIFC